MPYYIINTRPDEKGLHEVHIKDGCNYLPDKKNQREVGYFFECSSAIRHLQILYPTINFDGCKYCCSSCHNG